MERRFHICAVYFHIMREKWNFFIVGMSMEPASTYGAPPSLSTTSSYDPVNTWDGNGPYSRVWMPTNGVESQNLAYSYYSPGSSSSSSYGSVGSSSSSSSSSSSTNYNWTRSNVLLTTHRSIARCCPRERIPDRTSNKIRPKKRTPNNQVVRWRSMLTRRQFR